MIDFFDEAATSSLGFIVSDMTYSASSWMLNSTHSLTHSLTHPACPEIRAIKQVFLLLLPVLKVIQSDHGDRTKRDATTSQRIQGSKPRVDRGTDEEAREAPDGHGERGALSEVGQ